MDDAEPLNSELALAESGDSDIGSFNIQVVRLIINSNFPMLKMLRINRNVNFHDLVFEIKNDRIYEN